MGGADAALAASRGSPRPTTGDLRWTATVASHVVFADPSNDRAPASCSPQALRALGHGAENGLWRNIYLRGAEELRGPIAAAAAGPRVARGARRADHRAALRLDRRPDRRAARGADAASCIDWVFTDLDRTYRTELSNGALIHAERGAREARRRT